VSILSRGPRGAQTSQTLPRRNRSTPLADGKDNRGIGGWPGMRGVLRASLASASVGAQRFHARGHRLRLGLRLRVRSELAGHTLAAIWL